MASVSSFSPAGLPVLGPGFLKVGKTARIETQPALFFLHRVLFDILRSQNPAALAAAGWRCLH